MSDPTWPRDEYDAYIGEISDLLADGASHNEIVAYLFQVVDKRMGMSPPVTPDDMNPTAEALLQLVRTQEVR
ncbi:hypothetical protein AciPR4_3979 [Terriglobus saanensis SP1PR4]|uniref:Uncharacterized protein n=1 Tax=Terriglobus saanensis (strain ATCC BAA-1853 / DSM 23119 / SP1PR4) TaxID=401053 RepID=E8V3P1_TERSS|nr:hypothetical protein AciPR4_3979 [Terriglobus saanensis SP1PR4]